MQGVCREPTACLPIAGQGYSMAYSIRPLEPGFEARQAHTTRRVWWRYPLVRRGHKTVYPLHLLGGSHAAKPRLYVVCVIVIMGYVPYVREQCKCCIVWRYSARLTGAQFLSLTRTMSECRQHAAQWPEIMNHTYVNHINRVNNKPTI